MIKVRYFFSCLGQHPPNNRILYSTYFYMGTRLAQWWELSPPTNMARVLILASAPYVVWVCCWFFLSPLLKNQHLQIPIQSWTHGQVSTSSGELLSAPWVNKLQLITIAFKVLSANVEIQDGKGRQLWKRWPAHFALPRRQALKTGWKNCFMLCVTTPKLKREVYPLRTTILHYVLLYFILLCEVLIMPCLAIPWWRVCMFIAYLNYSKIKDTRLKKNIDFSALAFHQAQSPFTITSQLHCTLESGNVTNKTAFIKWRRSVEVVVEVWSVEVPVDRFDSESSPGNDVFVKIRAILTFFQKCIEALIDKQYLERREGTKDEYTYMAWWDSNKMVKIVWSLKCIWRSLPDNSPLSWK